jgi:hypothetical protein
MGKKVKRKTYVSKGERHSVARSTVKLVRQGVPEVQKALHKIEAWRAGKNPWITVPGPSSNMRFVRVRANNLWGDPRRTANIYKTRDEE